MSLAVRCADVLMKGKVDVERRWDGEWGLKHAMERSVIEE